MRSAIISSVLFMSFVVVPPALLAACSGDGAGVGNAEQTDATLPDTDAATTQTQDGATDAAAPVDGSTKPDAADDNRIDPIELGRSWTYDVSIIGTYPICKPGSNKGQVLGSKIVGGKPSFQVQSFCPGAGTSSYAVTGDKVEIYYANTWVLSLDAPVQEGHTWTDGVYTYGWEKVGTMTVPAGTFNDCWKAKPTVGTSYTTFCRGIGPVRWHYVDAGGNGYDATLTAYTK